MLTIPISIKCFFQKGIKNVLLNEKNVLEIKSFLIKSDIFYSSIIT